MSTGLTEKQLSEIVEQLASFSDVERAVLFGSRARGTHKPASDVDIAIFGDKVTPSVAAAVKFEIEEETYLPFFFDVVAYPTIIDERFKQKIDSQNIVVYER
ncbi:MAG: nucleotidyltransferase family protein [Thermoguttaceae bacterium]